ncbi:hypothetical protein E2I00_019732 [Balaenoptera physalus]|uniref:PDEase domain-containing protein n=1 Tax=Balaenoptera physalus TaxID=9770 RepID=A0A643CD88_BALPH|nr:hypothetical protein E2I00_019732 [Balaenoptera physalus]
MDLFCIATGLPRNTTISLLTTDDAMVSIDPTMPANSERAFKINELKAEVAHHLAVLEKRVELEGLKVVEVEKCKSDIKKMREELAARSNRTSCPCKYSFLDNSKKLTSRRDVPAYPKMLSCLEHMYHDLGLVRDFGINPITLKRWLILSQPECNIFSSVPAEGFKQIRQGMITLILATDMARHAEIMDSFKEKMENFDYSNEEHMTLLIPDLFFQLKMILIKCCDISNEVRPVEVAEPWVDCLLEEYFMQSDREKSEGLPVAPFMDRDKVTKATAQIGFIKFVLIPMFETVTKQKAESLTPESIVSREESRDGGKSEGTSLSRQGMTHVSDKDWIS